MNERDVRIHIEELVIDGLGAFDPERVGAAVQRELARLVARRGLRSEPTRQARLDAGSIDAPASTLNGAGAAADLGRRVAQATYGALGGER